MKIFKLCATLFIFLSLSSCGSFCKQKPEAASSFATQNKINTASNVVNKGGISKRVTPKKVVVTKKPRPVAKTSKPAKLTLKKNKPEKKAPVKKKSRKIIVGEAEYAKVLPGNIQMKARMDTGAKSTSISALNIREFERDGEKWVKFDLLSADGTLIPVSKRLVGKTLIKQHGSKAIRRPEIMASIIIGNTEQHIKVNLADRSRYEYPVLIGRNYLDGVFIVDASRKFTQGLPKTIKSANDQ